LNDNGITVLLVTHEPDIADFAKRQIVFRDGKVKADKMNSDRKSASKVLAKMPAIDEEDNE
jgi:putative ABC transport system ATP-binding protein